MYFDKSNRFLQYTLENIYNCVLFNYDYDILFRVKGNIMSFFRINRVYNVSY